MRLVGGVGTQTLPFGVIDQQSKRRITLVSFNLTYLLVTLDLACRQHELRFSQTSINLKRHSDVKCNSDCLKRGKLSGRPWLFCSRKRGITMAINMNKSSRAKHFVITHLLNSFTKVARHITTMSIHVTMLIHGPRSEAVIDFPVEDIESVQKSSALQMKS